LAEPIDSDPYQWSIDSASATLWAVFAPVAGLPGAPLKGVFGDRVGLVGDDTDHVPDTHRL
jgi:hypothetical protein